MIMLTIAAATAAALPTASAPPQPSSSALVVARMIAPDPSATGTDLPTLEKSFTSFLLSTRAVWRGDTCDRAVKACSEAASVVARRNATLALAAYRLGTEMAYASQLDARVSQPQLAAAERFFSTDAGRALAGAVQNIKTQFDPAFETARATIVAGKWSQRAMIDEFYDTTASLPRAPTRVAPPPPRITPPK